MSQPTKTLPKTMRDAELPLICFHCPLYLKQMSLEAWKGGGCIKRRQLCCKESCSLCILCHYTTTSSGYNNLKSRMGPQFFAATTLICRASLPPFLLMNGRLYPILKKDSIEKCILKIDMLITTGQRSTRVFPPCHVWISLLCM